MTFESPKLKLGSNYNIVTEDEADYNISSKNDDVVNIEKAHEVSIEPFVKTTLKANAIS